MDCRREARKRRSETGGRGVYVGSAGYDGDWVDQCLAITFGSMIIPFKWPSKNGALPLCRGLLARLQGTVSASLGYGLGEGWGEPQLEGSLSGVRGAWKKRSNRKRELEVGTRVPRHRERGEDTTGGRIPCSCGWRPCSDEWGPRELVRVQRTASGHLLVNGGRAAAEDAAWAGSCE